LVEHFAANRTLTSHVQTLEDQLLALSKDAGNMANSKLPMLQMLPPASESCYAPIPSKPQRTYEPQATQGTHPPIIERARLTPDQAIHIYTLFKTKTAHTAAMLSAKYGISPKAIRDIWCKKSWAQETRPHWNDA